MPVIDLGSVVGPQGPQGAAGATGAQGIQGNPGPNQVTDQTSTNLNGVLFGSQSRVTVKPIDSDPTADSTNLVNSGGTDKAIKGRVPVYGMGKNLLDNWYFVGGGSQLGDGIFPINQRGQTSYSGTGYGIDRWKQTRPEIQQVVMSDCLRMYAVSALASGNLIYCNFYCPKLPAGTYTLSFLVKGATGSGAWYVSADSSTSYAIGNVRLNAGLVTKTFTATGNETAQMFYLWHQGALAVGDYLDIIAAKLECGSEQTLCHNEGTAEAPVWVLNEIPDYGEELRKCQRYYFDTGGDSVIVGISNAAGTEVSLFCPTPVSMNSENFTATASISWLRGEGTGWTSGYTFTTNYIRILKNGIDGMGVNKSGLSSQRMYAAYFTKLTFSAEP